MSEDFPRADDADLERWKQVWDRDLKPALPRGKGLQGWISAGVKRLLRPFVTASTADLWERQRLFNQLTQNHLKARAELAEAFTEHQVASAGERQQLQQQIVEVNDKIHATYDELIGYMRSLEEKLDSYRREAMDLRNGLKSLIKVAQAGGSASESRERMVRVVDELDYLELERRYRGTEEEIAERVEPYLPYLARATSASDGPILDLGCGRGEALEVFAGQGWVARGVDSNTQMVEKCREKGLDASVGDLFEVLASSPEGSLAGVVSFHVIEHLPRDHVERLVMLSWKALVAGGVLVLETPSPLSLMVGARSFWLDPTHRRPIHPDSLKLTFELAGFQEVERLDRQPVADSDRLPRLDSAGLTGEASDLAQGVNRIRDQLDALIYGYQDYGMVGFKA